MQPPPLGLFVTSNTPAVNEVCTKKALQYQWPNFGGEFLEFCSATLFHQLRTILECFDFSRRRTLILPEIPLLRHLPRAGFDATERLQLEATVFAADVLSFAFHPGKRSPA